MLKAVVTPDPWICLWAVDFCLSSRPQRSAIAWVVGRVTMVSTAVMYKKARKVCPYLLREPI